MMMMMMMMMLMMPMIALNFKLHPLNTPTKITLARIKVQGTSTWKKNETDNFDMKPTPWSAWASPNITSIGPLFGWAVGTPMHFCVQPGIGKPCLEDLHLSRWTIEGLISINHPMKYTSIFITVYITPQQNPIQKNGTSVVSDIYIYTVYIYIWHIPLTTTVCKPFFLYVAPTIGDSGAFEDAKQNAQVRNRRCSFVEVSELLVSWNHFGGWSVVGVLGWCLVLDMIYALEN